MKYFDYIIEEFKAIMKDEGVLLFFVILPIAYPILYSWIYNNEVVRDVPVVVVDDSRTSTSREFIRKMDASSEVSVALYARNMEEAKSAIGHAEAYAILYFPSDFAKNIGRLEPGVVSVYCDMSYMMTYKAVFQTAMEVSGEMNTDIQKHILGVQTAREQDVSTAPLLYDPVPIFNATGGYGNFVIPAVVVLIIQQAMLLGIGMIAGTRREERLKRTDTDREYDTSFTQVIGRATAYMLIFSVMLAWITLIIPRMFGFVSMVKGVDLLLFFTPYLLACTFFSMCISKMVRYRESVMVVVVFSSLPLLFISGIPWPLSNIPSFIQGISCIFPSTFGMRGFVRMSSMSADLADVRSEYIGLWVQVVVYFLMVLLINRLPQILKKGKALAVVSLLLVCVTGRAEVFNYTAYVIPENDSLTAYYDKPSKDITEAMPLGNGRLGALVSGMVDNDTLLLTESNFRFYTDVSKRASITDNPVIGLIVSLGHDNFTNYSRWINIHNASAGISYESGGVTYKRTYFVSTIDKLLFIRLSASKDGKVVNPMKNKDKNILPRPSISFVAPACNPNINIVTPKNSSTALAAKSILSAPESENRVEGVTIVSMIQDEFGITIIASLGTEQIGNVKEEKSAKDKAEYYMKGFHDKLNSFDFGKYHTTYYVKTFYDHIWKYRKRFETVCLDIKNHRDDVYDFQYNRYLNIISNSQQENNDLGQMTTVSDKLLSYDDKMLCVLPSLPLEWSEEGNIDGMTLGDDYEVTKLEWKNGYLNHLVVKALKDGELRICVPSKIYKVTKTKVPVPYHPAKHTWKIDLSELETITEADNHKSLYFHINVEKGKAYELVTSHSKF